MFLRCGDVARRVCVCVCVFLGGDSFFLSAKMRRGKCVRIAGETFSSPGGAFLGMASAGMEGLNECVRVARPSFCCRCFSSVESLEPFGSGSPEEAISSRRSEMKKKHTKKKKKKKKEEEEEEEEHRKGTRGRREKVGWRKVDDDA